MKPASLSSFSPRFLFEQYWTAPQWTTYEDMLAIWQAADEEPLLEHAWLFDHFYPLTPNMSGPCLEGWSVLSAFAAVTKRIHLELMVTGNTYRHPAVLANIAALPLTSSLKVALILAWEQDGTNAYKVLKYKNLKYITEALTTQLALPARVRLYSRRTYRAFITYLL